MSSNDKNVGAVAYAHQGETYRLKGYVEEARDAFDRAIEANDGYAWAHARRGATLRQIGDFQRAFADFDKAIELYSSKDVKNAWVYAHRGETSRLSYRRNRHKGRGAEDLERDFSHAIDDFTTAIGLSDGVYPWAYAHRGATYRLKLPEITHKVDAWVKHSELAYDDFTTAIEQSKNSYAWALAFRSTVSKLKGDYDAAFDDLLEALRIDLHSVYNAERDRAALLLYRGRYEEAVQSAERALRANPDDAWAVYIVAAARAIVHKDDAQIEIDAAESVLRESTSSNLCSLAGLALLEGKKDRAYELLCQAAEIDRAYAMDRSRNDSVLKKLKFDDKKNCGTD